ncbi:23S rRNA (cytidine(2498)-2'-O)-methyltransferase RlmM [Thorsellia anophelis]|uniref:Ribosomal RNA large subunit methyltransferase M n=1 Tax=Thorsellia anophelis DSM 18579 TaxID=1123402 RepID=A0A1I0F2G5_9GAMM|nr:23S rRNA (cytidine(2498)-2'-O)-methyltransferase RlmM [Thorsellia anophelis]SET51566.1 23S rRNA (cytidine2498-2'-O)-methyltransferase [Thorsellia anophelis DSM 18579]
MKNIILYCRVGFEKECAAEITDKANSMQIYGFARVNDNSAFVIFECYQAEDAQRLVFELSVNDLIFTRQFFHASTILKDLPQQDRISPIIGMFTGMVERAGELRVEVPDTNQGKDLSPFCRKITVPLRTALRANKLLTKTETAVLPVLHVLFITSSCCYVGYSYPTKNSPYPMGIHRLKFPSNAPSRSTLKLEEAFHFFIPAEEWEERLASGLRAVDLGASPGGWTYQLIQRSMMVDAIDNGEMAQTIMDSGQVRHHKVDGFKFEPLHGNNYWLVCDMIEKPDRITDLMIKWLVKGWCREAIFNLKLPMKKRFEMVNLCLDKLRLALEEENINAIISAKQLYHNREEVTVHVQKLWGSVIPKTNYVWRK